jgi:hypothetical protein
LPEKNKKNHAKSVRIDDFPAKIIMRHLPNMSEIISTTLFLSSKPSV